MYALVEPSAGYFIRPKIELGGAFSYGYRSSGYYRDVIGFKPYARFYFLNAEKKFNLFAETGLQVNYAFNKISNNSGFNYQTTVGAGFLYFVQPRLALEMKFDFGRTLNQGGTSFARGAVGFKYRIGK